MLQCLDNKADRDIGAYWERKFCDLSAGYGLMFTPLQIDKSGAATAYWKEGRNWQRLLLPDVVIWTYPGQYHEIKHKTPTVHGSFGLEAYRFHSLLDFARKTRQAVFYTIHNHALSGGRDCKDNDIDHWVTVNILELDKQQSFTSNNGSSYVNGNKVNNISIYYWDTSLWKPLSTLWKRPI